MNHTKSLQPWLSFAVLFVVLALLALLAACAPAQAPQEVVKTVEVEKEVEEPASATARPPAALPTPTPYIEERTVELEWPKRLSLGESDIVRLALIPSEEGYIAKAEFEEHPVDTKEVPVRHAPGYTLLGIARLDGVGFEISPRGDQPRILPVGESVAWRWTLAANQPGQQRLSISLTLRWEPEPGVTGPISETLAFGRGLNVHVDSLLGMTKNQAVLVGVISLLFGSGLGTLALVSRRTAQASQLRHAAPNRRLAIEAEPGIKLTDAEIRLLQALFARYQRLVLEAEFRSGYSGARAFLVHPAWADGRADAATIAKVGSPTSIQAEYDNYEQFVKDRLPPVTARIQHAPVLLRGERLAGLQYTFIAEPGQRPLSLRQALHRRPDPAYLQRLFATFGPNWWMQRQPYTFLAALEYDRLLPPHWVVEPAPDGEKGQRLDIGTTPPLGAPVRLPEFKRCELRPDGASWALESETRKGQPGLRIRWLSAQRPTGGARAVIRANRIDLLREWTRDYERFDLPDPLGQLETWLGTTIQGTRSIIHGDLNLENILVGPGELVWLIDFAATREGHPLFDFAHLGAEIIAHIVSHQCQAPERFYEQLANGSSLLNTIDEIARRCLFDPACPQEFYMTQALACLGALKYTNLGDLEKRCLYLAAAYQAGRLEPVI